MKTVALLMAGLAFVALLGFGMTRDPRVIPSPLVGEPAPAFNLPLLDRTDSVSLEGLAGNVVVMNFWASWCLACRAEHPALVRAWDRYRDRGVVLVGVLYQDTRENALLYLARRGGDWVHVDDPDTRTAIEFGVAGVPETFFIDRSGRVVHKHTGPANDELLREQLERLIASP
jgi:cytochrome c biogenesis protein CcmG, thiol:disulfide interchange protein DsbE